MTQRASFNFRRALTASPWQWAAFVFCFLSGVAIVLNVQMAGDAEWFFYAGLLHHGVRLYRDLHFPLQPLFVLETDAWMQLFGIRTLAYESISLVHIFLFCLGVYLLLREAPWPDWQKALLFAAVFFINIDFGGFRFDDYHIVSDICALFTLVALLRLHREPRPTRIFWCAGAAGILSGLSFTDRATEGLMLLLAAVACAPFLAQRRKLASALVVLFAAAVTIVCVVHLSGDTLRDWADNSIFHAAAAKGGNGSVLRTPFTAAAGVLASIWRNKGTFWFLVLLGAGALARRFLKDSPGVIIAAELLAFVALCVVVWFHPGMKKDLTDAAFILGFNIFLQNLIYPLCLVVLYRAWKAWRQRTSGMQSVWDSREILLLFAGTNMIAVAASQANSTSNGVFPLVLFVLFSQLWLPEAPRLRWLRDTWTAIVIVLLLSGLSEKIFVPYAWNAYVEKPMFQDREWIHHPVYGPMYVESDLLHFIQPLCADMRRTDSQPELLSLPYSYPNYFCATPPWHNYVQTWFDTTPPDTIHTLMDQLDQAPPKWILYQRQLAELSAHEGIYHQGKPIPQRELDGMLMTRLATGQWKLVDRKDYLRGDGWYLIQTRP